MAPCATIKNEPDCPPINAETRCDVGITHALSRQGANNRDIQFLKLGPRVPAAEKPGTMKKLVGLVLMARAPIKIVGSVVFLVSVLMAAHVPWRTRTDETFEDEAADADICSHPGLSEGE
jgi:hypothetical protein